LVRGALGDSLRRLGGGNRRDAHDPALPSDADVNAARGGQIDVVYEALHGFPGIGLRGGRRVRARLAAAEASRVPACVFVAQREAEAVGIGLKPGIVQRLLKRAGVALQKVERLRLLDDEMSGDLAVAL